MTSEQLRRANKIQGQINLIDELITEKEGFKKQVYSGSLPHSALRYLQDKPELAFEVLELITDKALAEREKLDEQLKGI